MANLHVRSNSLPSESHPVVNAVEDHLRRLKSSEEVTTSATSVSAILAILGVVHESINNLIQMPSIQQSLTRGDNDKWTNQLLEESLGLVDLCGFTKDVLSLTKESVQELQSSIRRSRCETASTADISTYMTSRKKINKTVSKYIKNFKCFKKNSAPFMGEDSDLKAAAEVLKEAATYDLSALKSVLVLLSEENQSAKKRSWSLLSMFTQTSQDEQDVLKQLKSLEEAIQTLNEELEAFYRTLVKSRVSLLNALNH